VVEHLGVRDDVVDGHAAEDHSRYARREGDPCVSDWAVVIATSTAIGFGGSG
jgi:hypothetical protein